MGEGANSAKFLVPRGLMPNPKTGTVTDDTAQSVREVKQAVWNSRSTRRQRARADREGLVHREQLAENARAVIEAVVKQNRTAQGRLSGSAAPCRPP